MLYYAGALLLGLTTAAPPAGTDRGPGAAPPHPTHCEVSSYEGTDSLQRQVTLVRTYNAAGLVVRDEYFKHRSSPDFARVTGTDQYWYADTVLTKCVGRFEHNRQIKEVYRHDRQQRRTRTESFSFEHRMKRKVERAQGGTRSCIITRADERRFRTWEKLGLTLHRYDERGRQILLDFPRQQEQYTWAYDSLNRPTRWTSYAREKLYRIVDYTYRPDGWQALYTFFEPDGSFSHLKTKSWEYTPQTTHRVFVNGRGQVTREVSTTEKGLTRSSAQYDYDAQDRPAKTVFYNDAGQPELTLLYAYR